MKTYTFYAEMMRQMIGEFGRGIVYGRAAEAGLEPYELQSMMNLHCAFYKGIKP